jgi:hypothetical protein
MAWAKENATFTKIKSSHLKVEKRILKSLNKNSHFENWDLLEVIDVKNKFEKSYMN